MTATPSSVRDLLDPDAFRRPLDEAVVERLLRAIGVGRVDPAPARFEPMSAASKMIRIITPKQAIFQ